MKATAQKVNENKFQPVELTLRFESEAELAVFMTETGSTSLQQDWTRFSCSNTLKEMFPRVGEYDFKGADSVYGSAYKVLSDKGYLK